MKIEKFDTATETIYYSHNGVTFRCTKALLDDAKNLYCIDLLSFVEKGIDSFLLTSNGNNFSVRVRITKDISENVDEITNHISINKITRFAD